jgi:DNA-3-methyladenine glycosylase
MNRSPIKLLTPEFFDRDPRHVARSLLGKLLIRKIGRRKLIGRIVETEAYLGSNDAAAHATAGKTARNAVLWGPPGHAYVYFIYGNHYCLNVSCLPDGVAGCVLFRALEPVEGLEEMAAARRTEIRSAAVPGGGRGGVPPPQRLSSRGAAPHLRRQVAVATPAWEPALPESDLKKLSSGPGRLCEAFGITRQRDNGKNLVSTKSDLQLVDDGFRVRRVVVTRRIGITKSAHKPLRFTIAKNPFVSQ